ncbi:beta-galactosidase [Leifsonia aquatica]|uniref:beta-galactosidase n=1 Tax=Leifsonia aquatica TaxID=144185 RepID=UPI00384DBDC6
MPRHLSGAMHYFRTLPEQWPHRLRSLRAMGLNTVETYLAWNVHEPDEGRWERLDDIRRFLDAAAHAGLRTIVRPGPYICAEWDNGGLPSWVTARAGRKVRTADPVFLDPVNRYLDAVVPLFAGHPGLALVQVENEYGSFGTDSAYLAALADGLRERGVTVPLITSDGPTDIMLTGGTVPGVTATVNFGSNADRAFATLAEHRPSDAPFCMEYWCGWFDHWGKPRVTRTADSAAAELRTILDHGASVNLYMAHGGSNFGTSAGANHHGVDDFSPTVTSYDYDAPLDERGAPTAKFYAFRDLFAAFSDDDPPALDPMPPLVPEHRVPLDRTAAVRFEWIGSASVPASFEELGVDHGLVSYQVTVPGPRAPQSLEIRDVRDRAHVFVDGAFHGTVERGGDGFLGPVGGPAELTVLVESMGRTNYGPRLGQHKGLGGVFHGIQQLNGIRHSVHRLPGEPPTDWTPFDDAGAGGFPRYFAGDVELREQADGYLAVPSGGKGYAWVNGFCLGRYWNRGPQQTLYIPWPVTRPGTNTITVLELDGLSDPAVELRAAPELGPEG